LTRESIIIDTNEKSIEVYIKPLSWKYKYVVYYNGSYLYFSDSHTAEKALEILLKGSEWHTLMAKLIRCLRIESRIKHCKSIFSDEKKKSEVERKILSALWMSVILRKDKYDAYEIADIIHNNIGKFISFHIARKYLDKFMNIEAYIIANSVKHVRKNI
ncbi:MAG: hypothetical protein QXP32_09400, partial [Nitrososphaeria archaeon]